MGGGEAFDEAGDVVPAILRQHARDAAHQAFAKETASVIGSCRDAMQRFPAESLKLAITVRRTTSGPGASPARAQGMVTVAMARRLWSPSSCLRKTRCSSTSEAYQYRVCWPPISSPSSCQDCSSVLTALQILPR